MRRAPTDAPKTSNVTKVSGLQTIVCSATLTMDAKGRLRPVKKGKKKNVVREHFDAVTELCKKLKFSSKVPKIINLTTEMKMPDTLEETYRRCHTTEKDLYLFYFL
jgi:ATP-dependent RNA helicase DDX24/MAK5